MGIRKAQGEGLSKRADGGWRYSVRHVGWPLALFAIIFQALISFGHHHFELFGSRSVGNASVAVGAMRLGQAPSPRGDRNGGLAPEGPCHAPCLVCLAIHASAPAVPDAGQIGLFVHVNGAPIARRALASIAPPLRAASFESRGPPLG